MPIINGQKVACAPCIRGHRSTKCNHAAERVMVPVRKPGRPLSTCPCPPDQPCGCGGVKVAIPRKQKCGCGGEEEHASDAHPEPAPILNDTPTSPTSARGPYRVNKSSSGLRQNGRKLSFEPSQLGRIDPNTVNIVNHFGSVDATTMSLLSNHMSTPVTTAGGSVIGYASSGVNGYGSHVQLGYQAPMGFGPPPQAIQRVQQAPQAIILQHEIQNGIKESHSAMPTPVMATIPLAPMSNGGHKVRPPNGVRQTPVAAPLSPPANDSSNEGGGSCCCGPKKDSPDIKPTMAPPPPVDTSKTFMQQLPPAALNLKTQSYQDPYAQQTVYTYPANYGSFSNPVNQDLWLQISNMNGVSVDGSPDPLGFSHECSCGPGCSCVGCVAHPFNQEMFNYVNNAYNTAELSPTEPYTHMNGNSSSVPAPAAASNGGSAAGNGTNATTTTRSSCCGGAAQTHSTEPPSPPPAQTPSDASGFSEEQALSTSDYFFVNIPYDPSGCNGSEVFCPCGDDCACDGCVVHKTRIGPPL
ncbi:hypothetical protein GQ53DRAFT_770739 [Thozetella sp. PMI_491]|nr:hypothetical protein GQ53DRAFT_770739 [Thozetella sp. PMI_491]